jgi:polyhydroxyalkanoate synthase subunit PhaC
MQDNLTFMQMLTQGLTQYLRMTDIEYHYNERKCVYHYDKVKLFHYQAKVKKPHATPVLVVFATVNRPEILDLFPEHSFIGRLLKQGLDVYLLDWGYPDQEDSDISLSDYVSNYLHQCVQFIIEQSKQEKINLIGICQGGLICLCYAALFHHIKNLVLISAPIDCNTKDNVVAALLKKMDVDDIVDVNGNVPGTWLTQFFISMRPFELIGKKYFRYIQQIADQAWVDHFLRVEKWLNDAPDQTGASFTDLVKDVYQKNKLIQGELIINGNKIKLEKLTIPILNVMAKEDEIVPMSSSRALKKHVGSDDYSQKIFPSGHIGIYISEKVGQRMPKAIAAWIKKR